MKQKKYICIAALILTAVVAACAALGLRGIGMNTPPVGVGTADMSLTAEQFCSALNEGDYQTIEDLINGYSSLNLAAGPESASAQRLHKCLQDSYAGSLSGTGVTEGMTAKQDIEVSYFSLPLALDDVKQFTQQEYDRLLESTTDTGALYDEQGNLQESLAMELYEKAIDRIITDSQRYTVTETVTLELVFDNGRWEILLTDSLTRILLGGLGS